MSSAMVPFAWLIGLVLPVCAAAGAGGLPVPPRMDMTRIERPTTPNTALASPAPTPAAARAGTTTASPDIVTQPYDVPAARLFAAVRAVADAQPRTYLAALYPDQLQAHWVARSAVFNFPDLITAQVLPAGPDANPTARATARPTGSTLVLYSRSVYGRSDLGVNRRRLVVWLAALDASLHSQAQR
jgi:uncharacterized protein (DUF1499 family)